MNFPTTTFPIVLILVAILLLIMLVQARRRQKKLIYPFQPGGEQGIEVVIRGAKWDEIFIWFEGKQVGVFSRRAMRAGQELQLSDGSRLELKLSRNQFQPERLKISRNGQPIHRIVTEDMHQAVINYAGDAIYLIGFSTLILGVVSLFIRIKILEPMTFGWPYILFGLLFVVLGFFTRRRSMPALMLAILIYSLDGLVSLFVLFSALASGSYILFGNPFVHIGFLVAMVNGIDGINAIRGKHRSPIVAAVSIIFSALIVLSMCGLVALVFFNFRALGALLRPLPHLPSSNPTMVVSEGSNCSLTLKDPTGTAYIRDLADSDSGRVLDYLDGTDSPQVLGSDGGAPGDAWWYIMVTHRGKTTTGWVFANLVVAGNSAGCSAVQPVATPFP